jgi:hypothetical protein
MKYLLIGSLFVASTSVKSQQFVVADMESRVPLRDVLVHTDDNQNIKTIWDGTFSLNEGFGRISFSHPHYEKRYVLKSELRGDTIFLLPKMNTLREVVIYGERRFDKRMAEMMKPSPQQVERDKLPKVIPAGPDVLALAVWIFENTLGKKIEEHKRRKNEQKKIHQKEVEYQQRWDALEGKDKD